MSALLALVQWLSPAFPTGAYAYSHGLESVISQGVVRDSSTLHNWLEGVLAFGAGWQDAVLLARTLAGDDPDALDDLARALAPSAERLEETLAQGAALARTLGGMGQPIPPRALPVGFGQAAAPLGLPLETVISLYLQSFASNLCIIAVRYVPLGQTEGQALLASLAPLITALSSKAATASLDDFGSAALAADLAAMAHETQTVRIFRT